MRNFFSALSIVAMSFALVGCDPMPKKPAPGGHDHAHSHEGPDSYSAAVTDIEKYRGIVKTAFENNKIDDAHDALHDIGHAIESIGTLASKEGFAEADLASAKKATESLLDAFGAIDETLHGGKGKSYSEVSEQVDQAITTLNSFIKK
jgi:hypothetical protein